MKTLAVLALLFLQFWGVCESDPFRCLLFRGKCVATCPSTMHAYHTRCDQDTISQRTCAFPYAYTLGFTCGWSRCDCNNGLFLEEGSGICVQKDDCETVKVNSRRNRKKFRPKKLNLKEEEDTVPAFL